MHVRFHVPWETTLYIVDQIIVHLGDPKLLFHDCYFSGEVDSRHLDYLYDLQAKGKIKNLGFLVVSGEPFPQAPNDDG